MSLAEIQEQAAALTAEERIKLAAFLSVLRLKESGEWEKATGAEPSDRSGWVSLDEARQRLLGEN